MSQKFYDTKPEDFEIVSLDIETTGFKSTDGDFITVIVLHYEDQQYLTDSSIPDYYVFLNTNGDKSVDIEGIREKVNEGCELDTEVFVFQSEKELLENVEQHLSTNSGENTILTAFNGETYRANTDFDIPWMRTECLKNGVGWILEGYKYTDTYEVFSQKSRFDTTRKSEPSLSDIKKTDIQGFIDDMGIDVRYDSMNKSEIVDALSDIYSMNGSVESRLSTAESFASAVSSVLPNEESEINEKIEEYVAKPDDSLQDVVSILGLTSAQLKKFIDNKGYDIPYDNMRKDEIISKVRATDYTKDMLVEWHEKTGRSIGTEEATTLDGIHEALIEESDIPTSSLPFEIEEFDPFDPFESSGEAVTQYMNGNYSDVILHCLADVARTANLNRLMIEYVPMSDYKPKIL